MRSSLPLQIGVAIAAFTIGLIAVEMRISAETSPITVSGMVLLDGKPLPQGTIRFLSKGTEQPASDVGVIRGGEYIIPDSETLVPAAYEVRISGRNGAEAAASTDPVPVRYNRESVLQVEVKRGGSHRFNFELKR
ncbi:MAG: hypothetical protein U0790_06990 [Isosphaeraceae bacterium]